MLNFNISFIFRRDFISTYLKDLELLRVYPIVAETPVHFVKNISLVYLPSSIKIEMWNPFILTVFTRSNYICKLSCMGPVKTQFNISLDFQSDITIARNILWSGNQY